MPFLTWIVLGLVAGWVASLIMKTDGSQGLLKNILMGVLGAVVGGWLLGFLGMEGVTGLDLYSIGVAVLGAAVLIWVGRLLK